MSPWRSFPCKHYNLHKRKCFWMITSLLFPVWDTQTLLKDLTFFRAKMSLWLFERKYTPTTRGGTVRRCGFLIRCDLIRWRKCVSVASKSHICSSHVQCQRQLPVASVRRRTLNYLSNTCLHEHCHVPSDDNRLNLQSLSNPIKSL